MLWEQSEANAMHGDLISFVMSVTQSSVHLWQSDGITRVAKISCKIANGLVWETCI